MGTASWACADVSWAGRRATVLLMSVRGTAVAMEIATSSLKLVIATRVTRAVTARKQLVWEIAQTTELAYMDFVNVTRDSLARLASEPLVRTLVVVMVIASIKSVSVSRRGEQTIVR